MFLIQRLENHHCNALGILHQKHFERSWSAQDFEDLLSKPHVRGVGIFVDSHLVGFVLWSWVIDEAEIYTLVVESSYRRQGYVKEMEKILLLQKVNSIFLEVEENNHAATLFYQKNNFSNICIRDKYYAKKDGETKNAIVMAKFFVK